MKKLLFIVASAMLVFASCTNNEEQSEPTEINFSAFNYKPTKAPIIGTIYGTDAPDFGVFAAIVATTDETSTHTYALNYAGSSLYMDDVKIKYDATVDYKIWRPVNADDAFVKYYWPLTGKLTFVGYSPYSVSADFVPTTRTFTITNYSADVIVANQADVMYSKISSASDMNATSASTQYTGGGGTNSGVNILFNHALSQIIFRAKTTVSIDDATFKIDEIKMIDVKNKGTLTVENDVPTAGDDIIDGWTLTAAPADIVNFNVTTGITDDLTNGFVEYGGKLLLIPQEFTDATKVSITYTMTPKHSDSTPTSKTVVKNITDLSNLTTINANKKYIINLTIGPEEILFAPSIAEDWDAITGVDQNF